MLLALMTLLVVLKWYETRFAWHFNILPGEYQDKTMQSSSRQSSLINLKSREVNQTFLNTVWINLCWKSLTCSEKKLFPVLGTWILGLMQFLSQLRLYFTKIQFRTEASNVIPSACSIHVYMIIPYKVIYFHTIVSDTTQQDALVCSIYMY